MWEWEMASKFIAAACQVDLLSGSGRGFFHWQVGFLM